MAKFKAGMNGESRLTQPLALEDGRPPRVLSATLYSISAFVLAGLVWASVTEIREMTAAPGQIIPRGQTHLVQHLEGGIIAEILVRDGAKVLEGQPIVRLAPAQAQSEAAQMTTRAASLKLAIIRLDAQISGSPPDFGATGAAHPALAQEQLALFHSDAAQRKRERETLMAKLRQRQSELQAFRDEELVTSAQVSVQKDQFTIQEKLVEKGYSSRKTFLDALAAYQRSQSELVIVRGKVRTTEEAVSEVQHQMAEVEANAQRKAADERNKAAGELAETESQLLRLSDRVDRLVVRAPSAGMVQDLAARSVGEVVRPSDIVARVVPEGLELVAEVRIDPKDIGHIKPGAPVDVKFTTFDPALFGALKGKVESIAGTTSVPQPGQINPGLMPNSTEPFYKAIVKLEADSIGQGNLKRPIHPGMVVSAEIITGSKTLTRYMLKPVFRSLDLAFSER